MSSAMVLQISRNYSIACDDYAQNGVKSRILSEINMLFYSHFYNANEGFVTIEYSDDGKINQIFVNTIKINILASKLSNEINNKIESVQHEFTFPLGNTLGVKYFSGLGPNIKVKIQKIASIQFEVGSNIIDCGINQTLHRIILKFYIQIDCIVPFYSKNVVIEPSVVLAETLIIGDVPNILFPVS